MGLDDEHLAVNQLCLALELATPAHVYQPAFWCKNTKVKWGYSDSVLNTGEILILEDRSSVTRYKAEKYCACRKTAVLQQCFSLANSTVQWHIILT